MLEAKMTKHSVQKPIYTTNQFNEKIINYASAASVDMFITFSMNNPYLANDIIITECNYIGVTNSSTLVKGMLIDERYKVEFIRPNSSQYIVYMKEIENNGIA